MVQRAELDETHESMAPECEQKEYDRWTKQVYDVLQNLPKADTPPVCDWTKPESKTTPVGDGTPASVSGTAVMALIIIAVAAAVGYHQLYMQE